MTPPERPASLDEALALHRRGALADAEREYRRLVEGGDATGHAEHMLGLVLHQQGRSEEALPWLDRARARGESPSLWVNTASVLLALGRATEAEDYAARASAAQPAHVGAMLNLGLAREARRRYPQAIEILERALAAAPDHLAARRTLARCLLRIDDAARAIDVLAPVPVGSDAGVDLVRSEAWIAVGSADLAQPVLAALAAHPQHEAQANWLLASAALAQRRSDDAIALLRSVTERHPEHRMATLKLASIELSRGDVEPALLRIDRWLAAHPDDREARSAHLVGCQYSARYDAAALLAEHLRWAPAAAGHAPVRPRSGRPKRVGWVSPRFCHGPVETFFADVLDALRREAPFEHVLYMTAPAPTPTTARFRASGAAWRDLAWADDDALLRRVTEDRIDVLVDLAGAGPEHRLPVFAARAAPLQLTWLDYFCTTGVAQIDALITDAYLAPSGSERFYRESLLRLPAGRLCYSPPPAPSPAPEGADARRLVSLNRFSKVNDDVARAWSAALARLPGWTLRLKGAGGDDAGVANALRRRFAAHGVEASRIEIAGAGPYAEAIDAYRDAAVALDPFPFSGCATTFDALWMGLPVITRPFDTMASRQSGAILSSIGRDDWIADDEDGYVDRIVEVARDVDARRAWRAEARARMRPLTDATAFARTLAAAILEAWDRPAR
jgi:predicted O-linked N-acetylglucosamine transferase (SPINDLY family)